jgi:hypothetical protein
MLQPIIRWVFNEVGSVGFSEISMAEFSRVHPKPRTLSERLEMAVRLYPCDILFIHRDSEREDRQHRHDEIREAFQKVVSNGFKLPAVAVVPVRMLEAWLCFNEAAIRRAAGNPNGTTPLSLPTLSRVEAVPDPKAELHQALRNASGLTGRRLKRFDPNREVRRILDYTDDFGPLRKLKAFQAFEEAARQLIHSNWKPGLY